MDAGAGIGCEAERPVFRRRICKVVMVRGRGVERQEWLWFWR
jgi:hypothetical protein